ncbi:CDP-glucose 4,6-dehydratase [Rhizobium sp. RHZ02]|uniref:CDP-glucose 4,6-dehydratase n=1 Tax=Rhizobium sp. RHZ02 TaxID=2769306 RepID=UPI001781E997|nr:CDP-glucose 4,6-dehydratase [Rhizobium sp. RHZ02]MBD9453528.1 CDP-glucose 4,6-dehydratase [Rhizobium sp. RHZ02]
MNAEYWNGRRVLVTGHTGFKGGWLTFWLAGMGAKVAGLGLPPSSEPNLYNLLGLAGRCQSTIGDINQPGVVAESIALFEPEVIIHMAAQALVRASYTDPIGTYETNVMGVVRLLDAARLSPSVRSIVIVTSDKCYENREQIWGYRENDAMGGHDPYSSSKGAAEIAAHSMQRSFFQPFVDAGHPARIATVRAGNVIGGGDWSSDRLVPDIVRGLLGPAGAVHLRNPKAVRPWQHVLEPLAAYLRIAELLDTGATAGVDDAWNIGPDSSDTRPVLEVAEAMVAALGKGRLVLGTNTGEPHEATLLTLDCTKARTRLGWRPRLMFEDCMCWTADWYAAWHRGEDMTEFTRGQITQFDKLEAARHYPRVC